MVYGYARCSTNETMQDINRQVRELKQQGKSGMENAKAKGIRMGRRPTVLDDIPQAFFKHYPKYKAGAINKREYARLCNLSYPTIYKYLEIIETAGN